MMSDKSAILSKTFAESWFEKFNVCDMNFRSLFGKHPIAETEKGQYSSKYEKVVVLQLYFYGTEENKKVIVELITEEDMRKYITKAINLDELKEQFENKCQYIKQITFNGTENWN